MGRNHATVNYVEPNDRTAYEAKDRRRYSLIQPLEDYCIALNIEAEVHGREMKSNEGEGTDVIILSWESKKDGDSHVNFMSGRRILRNGPQDNAQNPNYLTTNPSDMYLDDLIDYGTTEAIGIKSVDVSYQSGTVPAIQVKLTDVRGLSMFQPQEMMRDASYLGVKGVSADKVAQSFFQCFFRIPYPRFRLYLKGFYGKAVSYEMMCDKFDTNFNSSTGDFDVTIHFIGYMYSFLTDISFQMLAACPYSDYVGQQYWEAEKASGRFMIPDIDGIMQPMPTLTEMCIKYRGLMDDSDKEDLLTGEESEDDTHELEIARLQSLKQEYVNWYTSLIANVNKMYGEVNCHVIKTVGDDADYMGVVILVQADADADMSNAYAQFDSDFRKLNIDLNAAVDEEISAFGDDYVIDEMSEDFSDYQRRKLFVPFYVNGAGEITYDGLDPDTPIGRTEIITKMLTSDDGARNSARYRSIYNDGANQRIYCYCIKNDTRYLSMRINALQADANRIAKERSEGHNLKRYNRLMYNKLTYYPTLENFMKVMFAHLETFMKMMYDLISDSSVSGRTAESLGITLGPDGNATDVNPNSKTVPPFPRVSRLELGDDGITRREDTWIEEFNGGTGFKEVDFVNGIFNGIQALDKLERDANEDLLRSEHARAAANGEDSATYLPITSYDYFISPKVFNMLSSDLTVKGYNSFRKKLLLRALGVFGVNNYAQNLDSYNPEDAGRADGENLYMECGRFKNADFVEYALGTGDSDEAALALKLYDGVKDANGNAPEDVITKDGVISNSAKVKSKRCKDSYSVPLSNFKADASIQSKDDKPCVIYDCYNGNLFIRETPFAKEAAFRVKKRLPATLVFSDDCDEVKNKIAGVASESGDGSAYSNIKHAMFANGSPYFDDFQNTFDTFFTDAYKEVRKAEKERQDVENYNFTADDADKKEVPEVDLTFKPEMLDYEKMADVLINDTGRTHIFLPKAAISSFINQKNYRELLNPFENPEYKYFRWQSTIRGWDYATMTKSGNLDEATKPIMITRGTCFRHGDYAMRNVSPETVKLYLKGVISKLRELNGVGYALDEEGNVVKTSDEASKTTEGMKMELYRYLKQVHDKWIPSSTFEDWKYEKFFDESDDSIRTSKFFFIDSFYNKIGNKLIINPSQINDRYTVSMGNRDVNEHMLGFITDILGASRCMFLCIQNFRDITSENSMEDVFKPIPYNEIGEVKRSPDFVVVYPYEPSKNLNLPNNEYNDDGFMLSDEFYTPVAIRSRGKDRTAYYNLPAFGVSYGRQYQSYFKNVNVGMAGAVQTQQAIWAKHNIIKEAAGGSSVNRSTAAQDLFDVYANQSFTCKVDMMGCAWIQPLMYFVLLNIPMFKGSYMIMKVEHRIVPGDMTTNITACRMANSSNKLVQDIFTEIDDVDNGGGESYYDTSYAEADTSNNCEYKIHPLTGGDGPDMSAELSKKITADMCYNNEKSRMMVGISVLDGISKIVQNEAGVTTDATNKNAIRLQAMLIATTIYNRLQKTNLKYADNVFCHGQYDIVKASILTARQDVKDIVTDIFTNSPSHVLTEFSHTFMKNQIVRGDETMMVTKITIDSLQRIACFINYDEAKERQNADVSKLKTELACDSSLNGIYGHYFKDFSGTCWTAKPQKIDVTKELPKLLFEAIQKSANDTDNIKCELSSGTAQSKFGEVLIITQKDGKTDKLGKVFGLVLNGYYKYIQELYWVMGNSQSPIEAPKRIGVVASLKPNEAKRRVGFGCLDLAKIDKSISFWKICFTNAVATAARDMNGEFMNKDFLFSIAKKYGNPGPDDKIAIAELPQFVENGQFQSEIFKDVVISDCAGNTGGGSLVIGNGGVLEDQFIGDWNVAKSINWLITNKINACPSYNKDGCGGWCTRWVKLALNYDGFVTVGRNPRKFLEYLQSHGFVCVAQFPPTVVRNAAFPNPQLGDITIFTDTSKPGHTDIFCGSYWASDHRERYDKTGWPAAGHYNSQMYIMRYSGQGKKNP